VRDELGRQGTITDLYVRLRDDKIVRQLIDKAEITERQEDKEAPQAEKAKQKGGKTGKKADAKESGAEAEQPAQRRRPKRKPPEADA
jgi:hypothetical protein